MSHRTKELPPRTGIARIIRELRYHEASRQILGILLILLFTVTALPTRLLLAFAIPLAVVGTMIRLYASGYIVKNSELATTGPYALVRHPLYTGNLLVVIGLAIANGTWWALPLAAAFFCFYYPTAIEYEDRKLQRSFGATWQQWASNVPALIPNFTNSRGVLSGGWSIGNSFRRNGEIYIAIYIVGCLAWLVSRVT